MRRVWRLAGMLAMVALAGCSNAPAGSIAYRIIVVVQASGQVFRGEAVQELAFERQATLGLREVQDMVSYRRGEAPSVILPGLGVIVGLMGNQTAAALFRSCDATRDLNQSVADFVHEARSKLAETCRVPFDSTMPPLLALTDRNSLKGAAIVAPALLSEFFGTKVVLQEIRLEPADTLPETPRITAVLPWLSGHIDGEPLRARLPVVGSNRQHLIMEDELYVRDFPDRMLPANRASTSRP